MKKKICLVIWFSGFLPAAYSQSTLEERLKNHVYTIADDSLMGREAGSEFAKKAADYIAAQWEEIGITPLTGDSYFIPFMQNQYHNLAGIIEGVDPLLKDDYIVVGAHYDHIGVKTKNGETLIYNGADDNASGVATVIELGRNLKALQHSLRRSVILMAFDAEEKGLYGSTDFSNNPPFPINHIRLMMSIDMVGWYETSGYVKYLGAGTVKNGKRLLRDELLVPEGLHVKTQNFERGVMTATDTRNFAKRGLPTFAVTTGLKSPYHKPEDMADLIDYNGMALITEHLTNVVLSLSQDESLEASGKIAAKHNANRKFNFGVTANYGSNYHRYTAGAIDGKSKVFAGIGLTGQMNMKYFAIRSGIRYEHVGARHPDGDIATHGITTPLNFVLQTPPIPEAGADIFVGPYYNHKFAGTQGDARLDFKNLYNRNEAGINFGFNIKAGYICLGYTHRMAFTKFTKTKNVDNAHIRNVASYATIGLTF